MSKLSRWKIPAPADWQAFEELCCDLWRAVWEDPSAMRNGREGQAQFGVDVFGRPGQGTEWAGIQCKVKDDLKGSRLKPKEIEREVAKARDFNPRLSQYIIATTAPRDVIAQEAGREITTAHLEKGLFPVTVMGWEDIVALLEQHEEVVGKHYPHLEQRKREPGDEAREDYLEALWTELSPVSVLGVGRGASRRETVPLAAVYTALDVTSLLYAAVDTGDGGEEGTARRVPGTQLLRADAGYISQLFERVGKEAAEKQDESYQRPMSALEASAALSRAVLLGPAGSGKSTFARYLALCLVGERLGRTINLASLNGPPSSEGAEGELPTWPHGAVLPVFVELRKLVRSDQFPGEADEATEGHLLAYLEARGTEKLKVGPLLRGAFRKRNGALLILDGLDETPAAEDCRERIQRMIVAFCERYPHCRVLLTCRPYAYEPGSAWRLDELDFEETSLAPFDDEKIRRFIDGWYAHLAQKRLLEDEQATKRAAALWREIQASPDLKPLAERPLLLTMMADVHASSGGRLPAGRAGLYESSLEILLDRWNEKRDVLDQETLAEHLGMNAEEMREALEGLAYRVHRERGAASGTEPAEISDAELWQALDHARPRPLDGNVDERRVMDYLNQRSGILVGESETVYRFPHRSFQEYMAACYLVRTEFPELLRREVTGGPTLWREVLLLAAGKVAKAPFMEWALLSRLVPGEPPAGVKRDDSGFVMALYAGLAVQENDLWQGVQAQDEAKLEDIRQWLEKSLEVGALAPVDRAAAGRVLDLLGDQRPGVGLTEDRIPDIDWVDIPAGTFVMGSSNEDPSGWSGEKPQVRVELPAFGISPMLVTNRQFRAFVEDGGYTERQRDCWSDEGWEWKAEREGPDDEQLSADWLLDNHPRVYVTWHEAVAFSRWLSGKLGHEVRLPSEEEWERAARGTDGQLYPWGAEFEASLCNTVETGIGQPSAVGMFPDGASPEGVLDLAGNVWEWTLSEWTEDHSGKGGRIDPGAEAAKIAASPGGAARVIRGGGCANGAQDARSAYRDGGEPRGRWRLQGFRVLLPSPKSRE